MRSRVSNVVLDLKPEGYQLLKFRQDVLVLLDAGTFEHTITAFWEYVLLLEISHKVIRSDRELHLRDRRLLEPYRNLLDLYTHDDFESEGDFSERMTRLIDIIGDRFAERYDATPGRRLTHAEITELIYQHDLARLRRVVEDYLRLKEELWILIDNLDKGWPPKGLEREDFILLRTLIDASRKIERALQRGGVTTRSLVFLRNDVYERMVEETPDRGKEAKVVLDWSDSDLLRELLRRRIVANLETEVDFADVWRQIAISHVDGEESSAYLIDRSLMRPRFLLSLLGHCRSYAVNLRHARIEEEDIAKGMRAYSSDVLKDIADEMRDLAPSAENLVYCLIGEGPVVSEKRLGALLLEAGLEVPVGEATELLLWYGILGVVIGEAGPQYVWDFNYDMRFFNGYMAKHAAAGLAFYIHPAVWPSLGIGEWGG